jgi:hypothetical protein
MIVGASHESAWSNLKPVLNFATPTAIQPGSKLAYCRIVDPRAETTDLGGNLRLIRYIVQGLFTQPRSAFYLERL